MKVLRMVMSGQASRQARMRSSHFLAARRALHELQDARARVLERHVEVGKDLALGHQRDHVVDVRIRIDVVQAHPDAELAERLAEVDDMRLQRLALQKPVRYFTSTP